MKYTCKLCNYESSDKSNYNRHLKSQAHNQLAMTKHKISINANINRPSKFECPKCFKNFSSELYLSRHKYKHYGNELLRAKLEQEFEEKFDEKVKQIEREMELKYSKLLIETEDDKEFKQYMKTTKPKTYNISIDTLVMQTYSDDDPLTMIDLSTIELSKYLE